MEIQRQPPKQVNRPIQPQAKPSGLRQAALAQAPTARVVRRKFPLLSVILIVVSVVCLGISAYLGVEIWKRYQWKSDDSKLIVEVDRTKEYYKPKLRRILRSCDEALYTVNMVREYLQITYGSLSEEETQKTIDDLTKAKIAITSAVIQLNDLHKAYSDEFKASELKEGEELAFLEKLNQTIGNAEQGGLQKEISTINNLLRELK